MNLWNSTFKAPISKNMQRKTSMKRSKPLKTNHNAKSRFGSKSRSTPTVDRRFLDALASQGCILCRRLGYPGTPAEIHLLRTGMGAGQRNSNKNTIPLCPEHHRGNTGYHGLGRRAFERTYGVTELDLLREAWEVMDAGRAARISMNTWSAEDELTYLQDIQPIARAVHGEPEIA